MEKRTLTNAPSEEEIMQMRNLTGEAQMAIEGNKLPFIKFDGKTDRITSGHFLKSTGKDDQGKTQYDDLGENLQGVIIRIRKSCQSEMEAKRNLYTQEFDGYNEELELFERGEKQIVDKGTYSQLSASYPELKLSNIVYLFSSTDEKVYKLGVGGGSLNNLWTYAKSFSDKKETLLRYITDFTAQEVKNPQGFPYMQMVFANAGETPDWQKIWNELKVLDSMIGSSAYKKADILPADQNITAIGEAQQQVPVIEQDEQGEEIDLSKIPF